MSSKVLTVASQPSSGRGKYGLAGLIALLMATSIAADRAGLLDWMPDPFGPGWAMEPDVMAEDGSGASAGEANCQSASFNDGLTDAAARLVPAAFEQCGAGHISTAMLRGTSEFSAGSAQYRRTVTRTGLSARRAVTPAAAAPRVGLAKAGALDALPRDPGEGIDRKDVALIETCKGRSCVEGTEPPAKGEDGYHDGPGKGDRDDEDCDRDKEHADNEHSGDHRGSDDGEHEGHGDGRDHADNSDHGNDDGDSRGGDRGDDDDGDSGDHNSVEHADNSDRSEGRGDSGSRESGDRDDDNEGRGGKGSGRRS